jgi:hypothetical protein
MEQNTQQVPGYFVWEAPGSPVVVHLRLSVVDRLGAEIMRGFGAVPKRGAEVGGLLLGMVEKADRTIVRIEEFEPIPCEYRRGPSYLLSEEERATFAAAVAAARHSQSGSIPVGYYRSHTREGAMGLDTEDLELAEMHFASADDIVLMVKPFATKVSIAGFFARTDGSFPAETPLEFPFRRREMTGESAPERRPLQDRGSRSRRGREELLGLSEDIREEPRPPIFEGYTPPETLSQAPPVDYGAPPAVYGAGAEAQAQKKGWVWVPLSFLFLVIGLALGYQTALTFAPELREREAAKAFALNVTAGRNGDSLTVRWDRESLAVKAANYGVLDIEDNGSTKSVNLDTAHLREGTVVYQNTSDTVRFRLVIYVNDHLTIHESIQWTR